MSKFMSTRQTVDSEGGLIAVHAFTEEYSLQGNECFQQNSGLFWFVFYFTGGSCIHDFSVPFSVLSMGLTMSSFI